MGKLTVVTWNSQGETRHTASRLADALDTLATLGHTADVIVVQGADNRPGGRVYQMLAGLGHPYHPAPAHAAEGTGVGGYLLHTRAGIGGQETFRRADLATDPGLRHWLDNQPRPDRTTAHAELAAMGMPATAALRVGATTVRLLTWRVPRGPGRLLHTTTLAGGANPDAFLLYQHSTLAAAAQQHGIEIIAGDIGVTADTFNTAALDTEAEPLPCLLPGYGGVASGLQHIIGHGRTTRPDLSCLPITTAEYVPIPGHTHAVLCATTTWPTRTPTRRTTTARTAGCHRRR